MFHLLVEMQMHLLAFGGKCCQIMEYTIIFGEFDDVILIFDWKFFEAVIWILLHHV